MADILIDPDTVKRGLRINYLGARSDLNSKLIDGFATLLAHVQKRPVETHEVIQEAANYIHRQFRLRWVMIGVRNRATGACTYEVQSGMRPEAWEWQKKRSYVKEDFALTKQGWYNAGEISRLTRVYLEDENPLEDSDVQKIVNRPFMMRATRKSAEDTLEADFIDTLILTSDNDLLGWIEYSGTVAGKFPEPMAFRWIEFISSILAVPLSKENP